MSLSEFQEKKIQKVFGLLYDTNQDGVIEKSDFDMLLQKISETLDWSQDSTKYEKAKETLDIVWSGLMEYADTNKDAKITTDEWCKMWGDCLKDIESGCFPDWQKKYMDLMFDVNDKSGDDYIDLAEYQTFFTQFDLTEEDCQRAFEIISGGENISRDDFAALWKEYLISNDPGAKGNYLFGPNLG